MEDLKVELKSKHDAAYLKLRAVASKFMNIKNSTVVFKDIGRVAGCSHITVINYIKGEGKDGFLTEILTKAFKNYKIK